MTQPSGYQPGDLISALGEELPVDAVFTTFTFSPSTFQQEYLIPLLHRGCPDIAVLVDKLGYAQSLSSAATAQSIGTEYRLRQVPASGAFHGKLAIVRTRHAAFVGIGSGNITAQGLQTNAEVGGLYRIEGGRQRDSVQGLMSRLRTMAMLEESAAHALEPISLTEHARLLVSLDSPIFDQLDPPSDVDRIEIVSPFVDGQHEVVSALRELWPDAYIRLRMDPAFGALSDALLALVEERMTVLVPAEPQGGNARRPPVHGKMVCFVGKNAATVVLGSANLSRPALLTTENFEVVVERRVRPDTVDRLLSVPQVRWRKAKAGDRRTFRIEPPSGASGVVVASLHFRRLRIKWTTHQGERCTVRIWCKGRCIAEQRFAEVPASGDWRELEWELGADVREAFADSCYAEVDLGEGRVLRGWIEIAERLGMPHEAKRQLVFLDAIASDPLNCKEKDIVKFIELLQRRLEFASRYQAAANGGSARSAEAKAAYDDTPIARRMLLELGTNDLFHTLALERHTNRALDAALRDLRFFGRDRGEQRPVENGTAATANGAAEEDESVTTTQHTIPVTIETVLMQLFCQLADSFDAAESPQMVASLIAQIPTCIKGLAYAAERWLSPPQRQDCLPRYFQRAVVACLAPGIASILRRNGAVRRLPDEARAHVRGGPEFELGVAFLEAYLLLDHAAQPSGASSYVKDMYDVLKELPVPSHEEMEAAGQEVNRLLKRKEGGKTMFVESLRTVMEAVPGELAMLRRSRASLRELVSAIRSGVRDPEVLQLLAKGAAQESADCRLKELTSAGDRLRIEEIASDESACPACHRVFPLAAQSRLNDAKWLERCGCGAFVVRSLEQ